MEIISVSKNNFEEEVVKSKLKVLVDFNADWCGPCRMLRPILEEISAERDDIKVVSINIDEEEELASAYEITSIPCLVLFKNGTETLRSIGLKPKEEIEKMLEE